MKKEREPLETAGDAQVPQETTDHSPSHGPGGASPCEDPGSVREDGLDRLLDAYRRHRDPSALEPSLVELRAYALGRLDEARAREVAAAVEADPELQDIVERHRNPDPKLRAAARSGFERGVRKRGEASAPAGAESALPVKPRSVPGAGPVPGALSRWRTSRSTVSLLRASAVLAAGVAVFLVVFPRFSDRGGVVVVHETFAREGALRGSTEPVERLVVGQEVPIRLTPPSGARYALIFVVTENDLAVAGELAVTAPTGPKGELEVQQVHEGGAFLLLVYLDAEVESAVVSRLLEPELAREPGLIDVSRAERNERIRTALGGLEGRQVWMETSELFKVERARESEDRWGVRQGGR